jgi:hypothetical protein
MIPPLIMEMKFITDRMKRFHLWLPLFVIWPFLCILFIPVLMIAYIAECFTSPIGILPFSILLAFAELLCSIRGLDIDIQSKKVNNATEIKIHFI